MSFPQWNGFKINTAEYLRMKSMNKDVRVKVAVVGATGYAGAELVRILTAHPGVELSVITSRQYVGVPFADIYPALRNVVNLVCDEYDVERICDTCDVVYTALPHKIPMRIVPQLIARGKKVRISDLKMPRPMKNIINPILPGNCLTRRFMVFVKCTAIKSGMRI
jgi:aspartate-semialdehyde dehydrogenase